MRYLLIALLLAATSALGESVGLHVNSLRGLSAKQCETLLSAYEGVSVPKISFLWKTFDRGRGDCVRAFTERFSDRPNYVFIYFSNETCRRSPRFCEAGREIGAHYRSREFSSRLERRDRKVLEQISRRGAAISKFISTIESHNSRTVIIYGLEDDWTDRAYRVFKRYADRSLPADIQTARNPNAKDALHVSTHGADFIELHPIESNFRNKACIFSNDGADINLGGRYRALNGALSVPRMSRRIGEAQRRCNHAFLWWNNQGIENKFIRPSRRSFRIDPKDISVINSILRRLEK